MKSAFDSRPARWSALILAAVTVASCAKQLRHILIPNQLPQVVLSAAPVDTTGRYFYLYQVNWVGYDPDGRVEHYLYAIDPGSSRGPDSTCALITRGVSGDTCWQITRDNEKQLLFRATQPVPEPDPRAVKRFAQDPHVFVIKAVDDHGASGPYVYRAFFSFTQAPSTKILAPKPNGLTTPSLAPSVRFSWTGTDDDGVFSQKPVKYKHLLLTSGSAFPIDTAIARPDRLRQYYAPGFVGWDSTSAETTQVQYTNLTPNQRYLFVVVGFDEAGAYSPVFNLDTNMLRFRVGYAGSLGPQITFFNEFFEYTYLGGGYCNCPQAEIAIEVPAGRRITFNWLAATSAGADMKSYRWAVDIQNLDDDTQRSNELTDLRHWSSPQLNTTSCTIGPFAGGEEHRLYLEAEDNIGLQGLGIVRFNTVQSSLEKALLVVDDTRFLGAYQDVGAPCPRSTALGVWPTRAELDTFLFARGGVRWECTPAGTMSPRGLFAGYSFDTVGTRIGRPDLTVRLSTIGQYAHLVWLVDGRGATNNQTGADPISPQTALRYMTGFGKFNTIGAYVKQGGKVWMAGGGCAFASQINWDDSNNNQPTTTFSTAGRNRELAAGRFMYDLPHWQTSIRIASAQATITRNVGRWTNQSDPNLPYTQNFFKLPQNMQGKTSSTDTLPPYRSGSQFYLTSFDVEFLQIANEIIEDVGNDPDNPDLQSTLDTFYVATANNLPRPPINTYNAVMTYYHGPAIRQGFVFTGFSLWAFRRPQCLALVDFVLHEIWGLNRAVSAPRPRASAIEPVPAASLRRPWVTSPGAARPAGPARRLGTVPEASRSSPVRSPRN